MWRRQSRERLAERVNAATYGTVLVLAGLPLIKVADVRSGVGWELVTGIGLATYVAHAYAELIGDHLRQDDGLTRRQVRQAFGDGVPILIAAVLPALALGLGAVDVVDKQVALWGAVVVASVQLVGLGVFVGRAVTPRRRFWWAYGLVAAAMGMVVVVIKVGLHH